MNLNTLKRGFTKTNPERGLRSLPGAQKSEHRENRSNSVRVKGLYITDSYDTAGRVIGITAYTLSWLCNGIILLLATHSLLPFITETISTGLLLGGYFIIAFIIHALVILADGMRDSNAPWARKSIIVFWSGVGILLVLSILLAIIQPLAF